MTTNRDALNRSILPIDGENPGQTFQREWGDAFAKLFDDAKFGDVLASLGGTTGGAPTLITGVSIATSVALSNPGAVLAVTAKAGTPLGAMTEVASGVLVHGSRQIQHAANTFAGTSQLFVRWQAEAGMVSGANNVSARFYCPRNITIIRVSLAALSGANPGSTVVTVNIEGNASASGTDTQTIAALDALVDFPLSTSVSAGDYFAIGVNPTAAVTSFSVEVELLMRFPDTAQYKVVYDGDGIPTISTIGTITEIDVYQLQGIGAGSAELTAFLADTANPNFPADPP